MRFISVEERRRRLAHHHRLIAAARAESPAQAADSVVGLHSSDPASVFLAARARMLEPSVASIEEALYDRRSVVRVHGMRRTMFVVPRDLHPLLNSGCAAPLAHGERRRLIGMLQEAGIAGDGVSWLDDVEQRTVEALAARGEAVAQELTSDVPELGEKIHFGEGKTWAGSVGVSTRVLFLLATEGRIVRGRPRGTWISSQYRWVPMVRWIGGEVPSMKESVARHELVRRWLASFGPGTVADLKWWTGWTLTKVRDALEAIDAVEVATDTGSSYVLSDDVDEVPATEPWVALLPSLDPTVMGWYERDWYLGPHRARLFDRNGNAGPTIWVDGRVVGGWGHHGSGEIRLELLEDVGSDAMSAVEQEAARLEHWLGDVRVTPRFRTPLERELSS